MKSRQDLLITLAVVACSAVLLAGLIYAVGGNPLGRPHLRFTVDLKDATGIAVRSDATYAGDAVGSVEKIVHLREDEALLGSSDHRVRVHVAVTEEVPIPRHVGVRVKSVSLLGNSVLALERLDDDGGLLEDGAALVGETGGALDSLVPGSGELVGDLKAVIAKINGIADGLAGEDDGRNLSAAVANFRALSEDLRTALGGEEGLAGLSEKLHTVADDLHAMVAGGGEEGDESIKEQVDRVLANLDSLTTGWDETFAGDEGVNARLDQVADGLDAIVNGDPDAGRDALGAQVSAVTGDMRRLAEDLQVILVYAQYFSGTLAERPRRLIFGDNQHLALPTKEEIIEHYRRKGGPFPVDLRPAAEGAGGGDNQDETPTPPSRRRPGPPR